MSKVIISDLTKSFGDVQVLKGINEVFEDGEFVTLLGPSGCGKTTLLRMIAGFEKPTSGEIRIDDHVVNSNDKFVAPEHREIGMVFQSYAVWPHMNVFENVAYPLRLKKVPKQEIKERVEEYLKIVHLSQYADRIPSQLSGGQQQRVALGRALVSNPRILLLDEPLSNLDAKLRESMRYEIKEIQKRMGITVVFVTHDQVEAMTMSDRVLILNRGVVQQSGTPREIYANPANQFVADFIGKVNFVPGTAVDGKIDFPDASWAMPYDGDLRGPVVLTIRPENVTLHPYEKTPIKAVIEKVYFMGSETEYFVRVGEQIIRVVLQENRDIMPSVGDKVSLEIDHPLIFPDDGQAHTEITT